MQKDPEENHEGTQSGYLKDRLRFESFICRITFFFLITWSRILLKGLIVPLLANKFSRFYETQQFMTVFTSDCHLPLSQARSIQSTPLSRFLNNHFNSISLLQLGIPHCLFPSAVPAKILYVPLLSHLLATCPCRRCDGV